LGNGSGFSVQEVIETAKRVVGHDIPVVYGERRAGDPARLVADSARARRELGWQPRYADLGTIIEHAWRWESRISQ
jgi:UDP-glucose 4-epimerase